MSDRRLQKHTPPDRQTALEELNSLIFQIPRGLNFFRWNGTSSRHENGGTDIVGNPPLKKTCLDFYKELISHFFDQWVIFHRFSLGRKQLNSCEKQIDQTTPVDIEKRNAELKKHQQVITECCCRWLAELQKPGADNAGKEALTLPQAMRLMAGMIRITCDAMNEFSGRRIKSLYMASISSEDLEEKLGCKIKDLLGGLVKAPVSNITTVNSANILKPSTQQDTLKPAPIFI